MEKPLFEFKRGIDHIVRVYDNGMVSGLPDSMCIINRLPQLLAEERSGFFKKMKAGEHQQAVETFKDLKNQIATLLDLCDYELHNLQGTKQERLRCPYCEAKIHIDNEGNRTYGV